MQKDIISQKKQIEKESKESQILEQQQKMSALELADINK